MDCSGCAANIVNKITDPTVSGITIIPTVAPGSNGQCGKNDSGDCVQERPCHITGTVFLRNNYPVSIFKVEWTNLDGTINTITLAPGDQINVPVDVLMNCGEPNKVVIDIYDFLGRIPGGIVAVCSKCS